MERNSTKKTSFNFDSNLLKDLKLQSFESEVTQTELIHRYIREGLMRDKSDGGNIEMNMIIVDEDTMQRLITKSDSRGIDTNELANSYILNGLDNDDMIPFNGDCSKSINELLDHDKPEGDDILEKMAGFIDIESELDAVQLKKASQVRRI